MTIGRCPAARVLEHAATRTSRCRNRAGSAPASGSTSASTRASAQALRRALGVARPGPRDAHAGRCSTPAAGRDTSRASTGSEYPARVLRRHRHLRARGRASSRCRSRAPSSTSPTSAEWDDPAGRTFDVVQSFEVLHLILDDDVVTRRAGRPGRRLEPRGRAAASPPRCPTRRFSRATTCAIAAGRSGNRRDRALGLRHRRPSGRCTTGCRAAARANKYLRYAMTRLGPGALYAVDRAALGARPAAAGVGRHRLAGCACSRFSGPDAAHRHHRIRRRRPGARLLLVVRRRLPRDEDLRSEAGGGRARRGARAPTRRSAPTRTASGPTSTPSSSARPTRRTRDYVVAALERGLHVLVEKPLTDSIEGLCAIRRAAAAAPAQVVAVVHQMRFVPLHRRIKALVERRRARRAVVPRGLLRPRSDDARVPDRSLARDRQRDAARVLRLPLRRPAALDRRRGDRRSVRGGRSSSRFPNTPNPISTW